MVLSKVNPMIDIQNISKYFDDKPILKNINLKIEPNETIVICGRSGAGKSMLLKTIAGIENIHEGKIYVDGVLKNSPETGPRLDRGRVGFVFQSSQLYPHISVLKNMTLAPMKVMKLSKKAAEEKALKLLEAFSLEDKVDRYPHELSGGEQQRVAIVRTLVMEPKVILFDEPCSALDPIATAKIEELMIELKEHYTQVIVTHNMQQASRISDYTAFLYLGRLIEQGPVREVIRNPAHPYTRGLLNALPNLEDLDAPLTPVPGDIPSPLERPAGCVFHTRCPVAIRGRCEAEVPNMARLSVGHAAACFATGGQGRV